MADITFSSPERILMIGVLALSLSGSGAAEALADDLKDAAPESAYLAVHSVHNSERDYLKPLQEAVRNEVRNTQLVEKILQVIQSRLGEGKAEKFVKAREEFQKNLAAVEWEKLGTAEEGLYVQKFQGPIPVHVLIFRIPDQGGESIHTAMVNLFQVAAGNSEGKVTVVTSTVSGVEMTSLRLPIQEPFCFLPSVGMKDDLLVVSTSAEFTKEALDLLHNPATNSKFDDPRVGNALKHLPKPEDSLVFFDGKLLAEQLQEIPTFIQQTSKGTPQSQQAADLVSSIIHQMGACDHEITVHYTEGMQERTFTYGHRSDLSDDLVMGKMLDHQERFDNWGKMIPTSATGFSLRSGVKLLPLYEWLTKEIPTKFPNTREGLIHFEELQKEADLHLKEDLFEAFSGETVSLKFAGDGNSPGKASTSVLMMKCSKPDRIQELLERGITALKNIPQMEAQGVGLKPVQELDGFQELTAQPFVAAGVRPVIGFRDGWMILGSHPQAVQTALNVKTSDSDNWSQSARFKEFGLKIEGPVHSITYRNTGENVRNLAMALEQAGAFAPVIISMAQSKNQEGNPRDLSLLQDILELLPAFAPVIARMDFRDATMTVTQAGPEDRSYLRQSATLIKPSQKELKTPNNGKRESN